MSRLPMTFNEARDAVTGLVNGRFKNDRERAIFLRGLKLGTVSGRPLQDDSEVKTFIDAIDLHLRLYDPKKVTE